jgi:hypothetical protein
MIEREKEGKRRERVAKAGKEVEVLLTRRRETELRWRVRELVDENAELSERQRERDEFEVRPLRDLQCTAIQIAI